MKKEQLITIADELNEVLGLEPGIDTSKKASEIQEKIKEASELLEPEDEDSLSEEVVLLLQKMDIWINKEEVEETTTEEQEEEAEEVEEEQEENDRTGKKAAKKPAAKKEKAVEKPKKAAEKEKKPAAKKKEEKVETPKKTEIPSIPIGTKVKFTVSPMAKVNPGKVVKGVVVGGNIDKRNGKEYIKIEVSGNFFHKVPTAIELL